MGNEKLWVVWPNPKDGYELQPLYQWCKKDYEKCGESKRIDKFYSEFAMLVFEFLS